MRTTTNGLFCVAMLFVANIAGGQSVFDDDSMDGTWENPLNWSADTLPGAADNVQIHSGLIASLSSDQAINDFTAGSDGALGTTGTINHSAGTLSGSGASWSKIGTDDAANNGIYNMSGTAALTNFDVFALGIVGAVGELNMEPGTSLSTNMGVAMGGNATVNQTGGTFTSGAWIGLANFGGGNVNYNISDGSVISNGDVFTVGEDGVANLNVSGTADVQANGIAMIVGRNATGTGFLNIHGSNASIIVNDLRVAINQDGKDVGANGTIHFAPDGGGVSPIISLDNTDFGASAFLTVDLSGLPNWVPSGSGDSTIDMLLVDNALAVSGTFTGLSEGAVVPGTNGATITYAAGRDANDIGLQGIPIGSGPVVVAGESLTVAPGIIASGGLPELELSDNMALAIFRDPTSTSAVTQFTLVATSPTATPAALEFKLEGRVVSRPNVVQRIELFNYVTAAYETVDEQNANRMPPDLVVTVTPVGDLSRFVDPGTLEMQARIRYRADSPRASFSSRTDQAVWMITP